jgi:hypothetical protein
VTDDVTDAAGRFAARAVLWGGPAGRGAVRQPRAGQLTVFGPSTVVDGARIDRVQVGDVHHHHAVPAAGPLVAGPVPAEELAEARRVFVPPPGHPELLARLRRHRVLTLAGDPGTGRRLTALTLLDAVAPGRVVRLAPGTAPGSLTAATLAPGHGYLLPAPDDAADREDVADVARLPTVLAECDAYLVRVADEHPGGPDAVLLPAPEEAAVIARHLGPDATGAARTAGRADVREALGLDALRPGEAAELAGLLARHAAGALTDAQLLAACRDFAPRQAAVWFARAGRSRAALREAAFRIALAVYDGAPYSLVAEAAETLAWELATTADPERPPGRPVFGGDRRVRTAAARAVPAEGEVAVGEDRVPVTVVRFAGRALAGAVLREVWEEHQGVRVPLCRWLGAQCDDPRPLVWMPAALAAGALAVADFPFAEAELLLPLAASQSATQRAAAATALAQAAGTPRLRPAVAGLLALWAEDDAGWAPDDLPGGGGEPSGEGRHLRLTAALAHGHGTIAGSVDGSLDALGLLARAGGGDADLAAAVAHGVLRLAAGPGAAAVLRRLDRWLGDPRPARRELAARCAVLLVSARLWQAFGPAEDPVLAPCQGWPPVAALVAVGGELPEPVGVAQAAGPVRAALRSAASRGAVLAGLASWVRQADREGGALLGALAAFLPSLARDPADAAAVRRLLHRLAADPDVPVGADTARRLERALTGPGGRGPDPRAPGDGPRMEA